MKRIYRLAVFIGLILMIICAKAEKQPETMHMETGNIVTFGCYEQDGNPDNGPEKIEWIILDVQEGKCLLLSRYCLDTKPYHSKGKNITWKDCSLRKWLNGDFLKTAFLTSEQEIIAVTAVDNSKSQGYEKWEKTKGGKNTKDRIFLLSCEEARRYLGVVFDGPLNPSAHAEPTASAAGKGAYCESVHESENTGAAYTWWWLRSPGNVQNAAAGVGGQGTLLDSGVTWDEACVRPALWVNLDEYAGIFLTEQPYREKKTSGDYTYTILENGTAEITRYSGKSKTVVIPETLDGHPVTAVGEAAFEHCAELTAVTIPDGVKTIGNDAFYGCEGLTSVVIPDGVETIGNSAFAGCTGLTSVTVPNSVKTIGEFAFHSCRGLASVMLQDGCTDIPDFAFSDCQELASIMIPDSVKTIGVRAFWGCSALRNIVIPEGVASIGTEAFGDCENLASITIPESVTALGASPFTSCGALEEVVLSADHPYLALTDGVLFSKPDQRLICFTRAFAGEAYTIPEGTREIGERAFWDCGTVTAVTIPDSLTAIGEEAFGYCTGLRSVRIPASVTAIGTNAFYKCHKKLTITVVRGSFAEQYCKKNRIRRDY